MTEGNPAKLIFFFSLPLMLGNIFQQVYIITDTLIISRTLGVDALAALGSTDWFSYMMISVIQAAAQSFAILISQLFGAGENEKLKHALGRATILAIGMTVLLTGLSLAMIRPVMIFQNTPLEVRGMAEEYLAVLFAGMPAMMLLNYCASMLRALGDSRTPLVSMVISTLLNVVLDYLMVAVLHTGVWGAAAATGFAQLLAGLYCLFVMRSMEQVHLTRHDFRSSGELDQTLLKLSWPMMIQNLIISAGGIVVQSRVNTFGVANIAGYTAANKLYGALELAAVAYGFAMVTYTGQNYGAMKYDRITRGIRDALFIGIASAGVIGLLVYLYGGNMISFFLNEEGETAKQALAVGTEFIHLMAVTLPILYVLHVARSVLQGFGDTVIPMMSGAAECIARVLMAVVISRFMGWPAMIWAEIVAWLAADAVLFSALFRRLSDIKKYNEAV